MASEVDAAQDWVILAGFQNGRAAEHMVASLGRGFRKKHRKGHADAFVINKDGSLKITQSRVLSASGGRGGLLGVAEWGHGIRAAEVRVTI
jgi:hypothetical protein